MKAGETARCNVEQEKRPVAGFQQGAADPQLHSDCVVLEHSGHLSGNLSCERGARDGIIDGGPHGRDRSGGPLSGWAPVALIQAAVNPDDRSRQSPDPATITAPGPNRIIQQGQYGLPRRIPFWRT